MPTNASQLPGTPTIIGSLKMGIFSFHIGIYYIFKRNGALVFKEVLNVEMLIIGVPGVSFVIFSVFIELFVITRFS